MQPRRPQQIMQQAAPSAAASRRMNYALTGSGLRIMPTWMPKQRQRLSEPGLASPFHSFAHIYTYIIMRLPSSHVPHLEMTGQAQGAPCSK